MSHLRYISSGLYSVVYFPETFKPFFWFRITADAFFKLSRLD